jgi:hypothetical protein
MLVENSGGFYQASGRGMPVSKSDLMLQAIICQPVLI